MTSIDKETFVLKMNDECAVIIAEMKDEARSMLNASLNNCKVFSTSKSQNGDPNVPVFEKYISFCGYL